MLRLDYTPFSYYYHEEIEFSPAGKPLIFWATAPSWSPTPFPHDLFHDDLGLADKGTMGVFTPASFQPIPEASPSLFTGPPTNTRQRCSPYQTHRMADWNVETGFRGDIFTLIPVREVETAIGLRRQRTLAKYLRR